MDNIDMDILKMSNSKKVLILINNPFNQVKCILMGENGETFD